MSKGRLHEGSVFLAVNDDVGQRVDVFGVRIFVAVLVFLPCRCNELVRAQGLRLGAFLIAALATFLSMQVLVGHLLEGTVFAANDNDLGGAVDVVQGTVVIAGAMNFAGRGDVRAGRVCTHL